MGAGRTQKDLVEGRRDMKEAKEKGNENTKKFRYTQVTLQLIHKVSTSKTILDRLPYETNARKWRNASQIDHEHDTSSPCHQILIW